MKPVDQIIIVRRSRGGGRGGGQGVWTPLESHKNIGFLHIAIQSYQVSIQCWSIIGTPAKHHLNGVLLACR